MENDDLITMFLSDIRSIELNQNNFIVKGIKNERRKQMSSNG